VLYGLGTTVGAGIYALTGVIAGRAGTAAPSAFLLASLIALPTALSFAELSSRLPRAGGEAVYVHAGTGSRRLATAVGLLVVAAGLISAATVSVAFGGALHALVPVPRAWATGGVVLLVGLAAAWGVRESVALAGTMTLIEVGGLVLVIALGWEHLATLPQRGSELLPHGLPDWQLTAGAAVLCFYAFLGFEDMVNVAEEVRDVRRTLPRAILLTLLLTALLYGLVTAVAVLAVPPRELAVSDSPLALVLERCGGPGAAIGVVALFALLNGALIQVMKAARVLYGLSSEGSLPPSLGRVHPRTRTPLRATALATAVALTLALTFPLAGLAETTARITLATFTLANGSLIAIKLRDPTPAGVRTFPLWVPAAGALASLGFVAFSPS
jgi:amino acid transporter